MLLFCVHKFIEIKSIANKRPYKQAVLEAKKSYCELIDSYQEDLLFPNEERSIQLEGFEIYSSREPSSSNLKKSAKNPIRTDKVLDTAWKVAFVIALTCLGLGRMLKNLRLYYCGIYLTVELV